jgi:tetratricopeptide (TPR) repeat protein
LTARYGVPNACTTCHENRSPEWAAAIMDGWYGDGPRRQRVVDTADAMYAAGSGDRSVIGRLGAIAVDRRQGALVRASAAGYLGRLATPAVPTRPDVSQALIDASADPEPMVRVAAVRAIGSIGGDEAARALIARTGDSTRVVRVSAAEGLLFMGLTPPTGTGARVWRQAQAEYAESLRAFPDIAANQTSLGWLLASQGHVDEATGTLRLAQTLDRMDARPGVYLGVLAARAGRIDDAIEEWRTARRLNPAYPNIDRLIAEAMSRK